MHYIVYTSLMVAPLSEEELKQILVKSRENNTKRGVTGVLLYSEGNVIQVLEGEKENVSQAYNIISKDIRHGGIIKLADGKLSQRFFNDWSMGFKTLSGEGYSQLIGYINPSHKSFQNLGLNHQDDLLPVLLTTFINDVRPQ